MDNTIAINALNSNAGGGKSIRDSFLKLLNNEKLSDRYVVIAAERADLSFVTNPKITVLKMPGLYSRTILVPFIYRFVLGRVLANVGAEIVVNFGDMIIRTKVRQIYVFDWAYALEVHPKVWTDMKTLDWLIRRVKLRLLKSDLRRPDIVVAQTDIIKEMLEKRYSLRNVRVINNAVTIETGSDKDSRDFCLGPGIWLVYPAVYYPHKNLEILLDLAVLIKQGRLDYRIVTTVDPATDAAKAFLKEIAFRRIDDVITNVGQVGLNQMPSLYRQCDALLMPTLLESFSIVYLEAMHHGLPIFTSDIWFAHAVCDEAAKYFDPLDAVDVLRAVDTIMSDAFAKCALMAAGKRRLTFFPTWQENVATYQKVIAELLEGVRSNQRSCSVGEKLPMEGT